MSSVTGVPRAKTYSTLLKVWCSENASLTNFIWSTRDIELLLGCLERRESFTAFFTESFMKPLSTELRFGLSHAPVIAFCTASWIMILIILASLSSSPPFCSAESVLVGQVWNIRRTSLICSYVPSSSEAISLFPLWMFSCHSCSPDSSPSSMQCILMLTVLQGKSSK